MNTESLILFLAANPAGTRQLALDAEARDIQMKLDATPAHGVQASTRWAVTPDDLLHHLNALRPAIVHFSGHGAGMLGLCFQNEHTGSSLIPAPALRRLFATLRDNIRVVVLNACYSSEQGQAIAEVIDAVVGMEDTIGDEAARRFAAAFYRALGYGRSVKNAFDQGVAAIALHGLGDESVPRLLVKAGVDPDALFPLTASRGFRAVPEPDRKRGPERTDDYPGSWFQSEFREIVAPFRIPLANAVINLGFGDLSRVRGSVPVLPINQSFDFDQRGPRSVLAAFEHVSVEGQSFYSSVEQLWPIGNRPRAAGLGSTHYLPLAANSMGFPGILFAVTTRNLSEKAVDYGYYVNTPLEGIDLVLQSVLDRAKRESIPLLALPLLGTGYANVRRRVDQTALNAAVLGMTIIKAIEACTPGDAAIQRIVIAVYSNDPQGKAEHVVWEFVVQLLAVPADQRASWLRTWCGQQGLGK